MEDGKWRLEHSILDVGHWTLDCIKHLDAIQKMVNFLGAERGRYRNESTSIDTITSPC